MKLELARWSIDVPVGWSVTVTDDQRSVRCVAEGCELSFLHVLPVAEIAGTAQAETQLRRRVPLGTPELAPHGLDGRSARVYHWRDGGHAVETWFVEAGFVLRIDIVSERERAAADAILASFHWS
ncbi:MAG TPA: hypothetical protein VL463_02795 [Kofleriaceae bacterium]|jgi:hypothetical protein|nr:hypothetical protein [Kofleriaceae bacterium]